MLHAVLQQERDTAARHQVWEENPERRLEEQVCLPGLSHYSHVD